MTKSILNTSKAPSAIGPYSQGVQWDSLIFTSGQLPIDISSGTFPDGILAQTKQSIENVKAILESAGSSLDKVLKTTIFIKNMDDFGKVNEVYNSYFTKEYPARSCVEVARLPKDALVEIEVIAYR